MPTPNGWSHPRPNQKYCSVSCYRMPASVRFWRNVNKTDGCWTWTAARCADGYGQIYVSPDRMVSAHRFSWEIANGPIPDGLWVLHACDNPPCVRPDHMFLGTNADNMRDMVSKGRQWAQARPEAVVRGSRIPWAKLTEAQVVDIRSRYAAGGTTYARLAAEYGVAESAVGLVVTRRTWTHVA
jgi:hypothetical protein